MRIRSLLLGRLELRRLRREPLVLAALGLVVAVPLLYGALYLWAFWDPYGHLSAIPVALVNEDSSVTVEGRQLDAGADLVRELRSGDTLGWREVSAAEARAGLADGRFYMSLTIPRDFSAHLASANGSHPESATLEARYAESRSMIATTIGQRVFGEVRAAMERGVSHGYFDDVFVGFEEVRSGMTSAAGGASSLASGLSRARQGSVTLRDGTVRASDGARDLGSGITRLNAGAVQVRDGAARVASGTAQLRARLADGATGAKAVAAGAGRVAGGSRELARKLGDASEGATLLAGGTTKVAAGTDVLAGKLGEAAGGATRLSAGVAELDVGASALSAGLGRLAASSDALVEGSRELAGGDAQLYDGIVATADRLGSASGSVSGLYDGASHAADSLQAYAEAHPEAKDDPSFAEALASASQVRAGLDSLGDALDAAAPDAQRLVAGAADARSGAAKLRDGIAAYAAGVRDAAPGAQRLTAGLDAAKSGSDTLAGGIGQARAGAAALATGARSVDAGASELAGGLSRARAGARSLAGGAARAGDGAARVSAGVAAAEEGTALLAAGSGSLASGTRRLADGLVEASTGSHDLAAGLRSLVAGQQDLSAGLADAETGSRSLADGLRGGAAKMPSYSSAEREQRAGMMGDPVAMTERRSGEVPTYGTGFAPYFVGLSLWVGAMVTFFLLRPVDKRRLASTAPDIVVALASYWPAIVVTAAQAVLMLAVLQLGLGLRATVPLAFYLLALLTAFTFTAVFQALGVSLGPAGKFVGIVLLMLQLTSAAGTFPIETAPAFFRAIHPWLPMTYVVDGFRQAISGGDLPAIGRDAIVLGGFLAGSLTVTLLAVRRARMWTIERLRPVLEL